MPHKSLPPLAIFALETPIIKLNSSNTIDLFHKKQSLLFVFYNILKICYNKLDYPDWHSTLI